MWCYKESDKKFFTSDELKQVIALFEAILPGSRTNPGATDVTAAEYLDRLLAMDESEYYEIKAWKELYRAGLSILNQQAIGKYGRPIEQLTICEVTELLTALSKGTLSGPSPSWQLSFFSLIRGHCIEGCFSDPRWGGNRKGRMWTWYGYPNDPSRSWNPKN
jgi:gluconate 2-dehydrogenase gamma chain